ncbi:MAG: hypothetical protein KDC92_09995 [Bacteroidetes bacterium]|nr:hypothetical protein [Bacteroidota bacterium]
MTAQVDAEPCKPKKPKEFVPFEKRLLKKGDSIMVYGGDNCYLRDNFGKDTIYGIVLDKAFSKVTWDIAFFESKDAILDSGVFCMDIDYWDSKRGYNYFRLSIWEHRPTEKEKKEVDFGFMIENEQVESGLIFKIIR